MYDRVLSEEFFKINAQDFSVENARKSLQSRSLDRILTTWSVFLIRGISPRSVEMAFPDKYKLHWPLRGELKCHLLCFRA